MKRFISLLLALMFMLALAVPALATDGAPAIDGQTLAEAEAIAQKLAQIEGLFAKIKAFVAEKGPIGVVVVALGAIVLPVFLVIALVLVL